MWASVRINPLRRAAVTRDARAVLASRGRLMVVEKLTGVPWFVVALIDMREEDLAMRGHLHNGDPLTARTVHVPKHRPTTGSPPFTFEESAVDALRYDGLAGNNDWSIAGIAYYLERYNGFGYRMNNMVSPYLWAGSSHYIVGKSDADNHLDRAMIDRQSGCMAVLKVLLELDPSIQIGGLIRRESPSIADAVKASPAAVKAVVATVAVAIPAAAAAPYGAWVIAAIVSVVLVATAATIIWRLLHFNVISG